MNPNRWRQIETLYRAAQDRRPEERNAFLDGACGHDLDLRQQVEALFQQDSAEPRQDSPTQTVATQTLATQAKSTQTMLSVGSQLGPYRIESSIGVGGMGEVYKATDIRLNRSVAVKILHRAHSDRFKRETRAIAALNHPNICTLYDVGPDYLVMEYVEGKPLSGPLAPDTAIRLALEIAAALEVAHRKGIIHRDLKPGNILVTSSGVKLLDFGLAKLIEHAPAADSTVTETQAGTILGTAPYMSPEQAEGKPLDPRSDIFSFGLVLYEMLCGRRAFTGPTPLSVLAAILHREPEPLNAPPRLVQIVMRCLRKDPDDRFQTMTEVKTELVKESARPAEHAPSIAVLPFTNLSADKENEYFSDGLTEEIINVLAHTPGLRVIARTSAFAFKGKEQDIAAIAEKLNVRTILEGSVRRAGSRIRVAAQLINAEDRSHLWSERYDRELSDVFAVQDEMASAIAGALQVKLATNSSGRSEHHPNLPAYEAYLKGLHQLFKNTPESLSRSKQYLQQAANLDPEYVAPHVALGECQIWLAVHGLEPPGESMLLVRQEARRTHELDPSAPLGHAMLGLVAGAFDHDWKEVQRRFELAMSCSPISGLVRWPYANFVLAPFGRFREAAEQMEKWLDQDPLNVAARSELAFFLGHAELYDRALAAAQLALEVDETYWFAHYVMSEIHVSAGKLSDALTSAEAAFRLAPWNSRVAGLLAGILACNGNIHQAEELIKKLSKSGPVGMLLYHLLCSDADTMAEWYEKAIKDRELFAILYAQAPIIKPVRQSVHWPRLARMMNLPAVV